MIDFKLQFFRGGKPPFRLDVAAQLQAGEVLAITGPSGSGKTTLLRLLAGLEQASGGYLSVNGRVYLNSIESKVTKPQQRNIGLVFQQYALFPNLTIAGNLSYAGNDQTATGRTEELLHIFGLHELKDRKPATLSGGQQQRVALARALVNPPALLLLDEPLSALDHQLRTNLQDYLQTLPERKDMAVILVSHDSKEILRLANQVIELAEGKIIRRGNPLEFLPPAAKATFIKAERTAEGVMAVLLLGDQLLRLPIRKDLLGRLQTGDELFPAELI